MGYIYVMLLLCLGECLVIIDISITTVKHMLWLFIRWCFCLVNIRCNPLKPNLFNFGFYMGLSS